MPKATSPFLSSLSGSLRGGPTFRKTTQTDKITMQTRPVPTDNRTAKQAAVRDAYARLAHLWSNLSHLDKEPYEIQAEQRNLTPWNCWLSFHLPLLRLNPLTYVPFVEGTGTTLQNFALNGTANNLLGPIWTEYLDRPALSFDGVDDLAYLQAANSPHPSTNYTVFQIILPQPSSYGREWLIGTKASTLDTSGFCLYTNSTKTIHASNGSGTANYDTDSTIKLKMNELNIFAYIKNGNSHTFYINGLKETKTSALSAVAAYPSPIRIGRRTASSFQFKNLHLLDAVFPVALPVSTVETLDAQYRPFFT